LDSARFADASRVLLRERSKSPLLIPVSVLLRRDVETTPDPGVNAATAMDAPSVSAIAETIWVPVISKAAPPGFL
jgi:hypothetical protein